MPSEREAAVVSRGAGNPAPARPFDIRRLGAPAGAEILGIDLRESLTDRSVADIREAILEHHVLVFRDQDLSQAQQVRFTRYFGELEQHVLRYPDGSQPPALHVITNLDADGRPTSRPHSTGNYFWHTDKSYHDVPSFATLLHARQLPDTGGDTQFSNMHLAYEALPPARRAELDRLDAVHSWEASRLNSGNEPATAEQKRERPPVTHPLVRTHPETGRKLLYIGIHVSHVVGMAAHESKALLEKLMAHAGDERFVYTHRWQPGDLVMWDNRSLLHRALMNYEMDRFPRIMHRTVIRGTRP